MASTSAMTILGRARASSRLLPPTNLLSQQQQHYYQPSHARPLPFRYPTIPHGSCKFFHSSPARSDHYQTLEVDRSASPKDIKNSFYSLSKKFHPDVNRNDDGAKKKFQEVSEAWSVLGDEKSKREYDRQLRYGSSMRGAGSYSSGMAGRRYEGSDNTARRARATYAWDYQRRKNDSNRSKAGQHGQSQRTGFGSGESRASSSSSRSLFEEHAARQRRREDFLNARAAAGGSGGSTNNAGSSASTMNFSPSEKEHEAQTGSAIIRFVQMTLAVSVIALVAYSSRRRSYYAEGRADDDDVDDDDEFESRLTVVVDHHSIHSIRFDDHR